MFLAFLRFEPGAAFCRFPCMQIKFETSAHNELFNGVRKLADAVSVTMGPSGHNVVMDKSYGGPTVTRDGVSVAKEIDLPGKFENMGAKMIQQVAKKTAEVAGDGTTAATRSVSNVMVRFTVFPKLGHSNTPVFERSL